MPYTSHTMNLSVDFMYMLSIILFTDMFRSYQFSNIISFWPLTRWFKLFNRAIIT